MPIGDLLASISGGEPTPKRKADEDIRPTLTPKVPRRTSPPSISRPLVQPSRPVDRPTIQRTATNGSANGNGFRTPAKPSSALRATNGIHRVTKPPTPSGPQSQQLATQVARAESASNSSVAPKKGSYAEIMARAKAAQAAMGQVGKIQHKKVEKGLVKKDSGSGSGKVPSRPDPRGVRVDPRTTASQQPKRPTGYTGTAKAKPLPRSGNTNGHSLGKNEQNKPTGRPGDRDRKQAAEDEQKKPKKAAAATTGYTGTARPRPDVKTKNSSHQQPQRGGALLNRQPGRPASSRHSRFEDDYDEDLDDFIEYDDEEDDGCVGPQYRYDSGSDSDMEAGMDDLELEERRAETIARKEDIEEEKLERSRKAAKEEKKRKAIEELRAKRR